VTFGKRDLEQFRNFGVPDLVGESCRLLVVGINPGLWTAAAGIHFAHPSNRFWPAMRKAGLIDFEPAIRPDAPSVPIVEPDFAGQPVSELSTAAMQTRSRHPSNRLYPALRGAGLIDLSIDTVVGLTDRDREELTSTGIGITNLVRRATARASELRREELRAGGRRLRELVERLAPEVVAVAGVTAYRDAFGDRKASQGRQAPGLGPAQLWVVPNPSGLNAHETVDSLADWYRRAAREAGIS
jgi:TDG/mug DNA glycosylase family protein